MSLSRKRLLFVGGGNMGAALAQGLLAAKTFKPKQIFITDVRPEARTDLKKRLRVGTGADNKTAAAQSQIVLLCVKPQQMGAVLDEMKDVVSPRHLLISIAAGVPTGKIESCFSAPVPVIRVMPNTPALLRAGAMAYCLGRYARPGHEKDARQILSAVGRLWRVPENLMDAVTALSGSGPAYVFLLAEALSKAGEGLGLPRDVAEGLARQTLDGAGRMLSQSDESPGVLRERVTSPGGTTEAALKVFNQHGFSDIVKSALEAASQRSKELSHT